MSTPRTQTSTTLVKVNGQPLSATELGRVVDLTIEQDLVLPDSFTLRILDMADKASQEQQSRCVMLDADKFPVGATVAVGMGRDAAAQTVFTGTVGSVELEVELDGTPMLTIRGYDKSVKMHRERKIATFENVSDSDLVTQIASKHGLSPQATSTTVVHEHVFQDNMTDWEFLRWRSQRVGYELYVDGSTLVFRPPSSAPAGTTLTLGQNLVRLRVRMSAPSQVSSAEVVGWDRKTAQRVVGTASTASVTHANGVTDAPGVVGNKIGTGKAIMVETPVDQTSEATKVAQSILDGIAQDFMQLECIALGDTAIAPGKKIKIAGVSTKFNGSYYVSSATHRVTAHEGYLTHVVVSGRKPQTLSALLAPDGAHGHANLGVVHPGVMVGIVTNNKDEGGEARVKVKLPALGDKESRWARLATPMSGDSFGMMFLPEVNTEVIVAFEQGDINHPYIVGSLWNGTKKPPKAPTAVVDASTGEVKERILKTRSGHTITINDSNDAPLISIIDKTGNNKIIINSQSNEISLKSAGNLSLEATGTMTIKGASINVEATGQLSSKGASISSEATGQFTAKGAQATLEGTAKLDVKGGAMAEVSASGMMTIKGAMVSIN